MYYVCGRVGVRIDAVDIEPQLTHLYRELKYTGTRHQSACQLVVQRGTRYDTTVLYCMLCVFRFTIHMWAHRNDSIWLATCGTGAPCIALLILCVKCLCETDNRNALPKYEGVLLYNGDETK